MTVGDPDQELEKGVCYDFTFQINKIKPMISVGNWTDFAIVDVTLYVKEDTILGRLVSGEYSKIFSGDNTELKRFYPLKNNITQKIRDTLIDLHNYAAMAIMLLDEDTSPFPTHTIGDS